MRCCQIQHNFKCLEHLCKLDNEYLISLTSKFYTFFLDKIWKLLTYHTPSYRQLLQGCQLSKTVRFLAHPTPFKISGTRFVRFYIAH